MDDLLGEDWQKPAKPTTNTNNPPSIPSTFASSYSSLRASPSLQQSRSASPNISRPASTVNGNSTSKPAGVDAFGSLLGSKKPASSNVSIQERQRQLIEEKRRQQEQAAQQWDSLGSGRGTPEIRGPSPALSQQLQEAEDDIMAAFNKDAPVDKSSHFPPPSSNPVSGRSTPAFQATQMQPPAGNGDFNEDDDPFELGSVPQRADGSTPPPVPQFNGDDDDILGDLGKPVTARPAPSPKKERGPERQAVSEAWGSEQPEDRALAELVDMGFPADNARLALSENGGDVQGAVGWLLQQAHEQSKQKARTEAGDRRASPPSASRSPQRRPREQDSVPAWMREGLRPSSANAHRQDSRSPANGDKDAAAVAQEYGTKFLKGATSLWKASQKQMAKTVAEFQQDRDHSQPKWMQDTTADSSRSSSQRRQDSGRAKQREVDATDEAAMLDAPRERPQKPARSPAPERFAPAASSYRDPDEPTPHRSSSQPQSVRQPAQAPAQRAPSKLTRQDVEDQAAQAYVSSARRRKAPPKPEPQSEPEVDLFSPAPAQPVRSKPATPAVASRPTPSSLPARPKAPPRNIPSVTTSALATSAQHRKTGGEAYKRGDYASAHEAYAAALRPLPAQHPVTIIVLSNRSMTALKTGDPKLAISDADQALAVIGASQGVGETIDLGAGEGTKDMREFYGKALMRKAEALEHLEKWTEAAAIWRTAVEGGIGGAVSIRGRDRCEKTAAPQSTATAAALRKPAAAPVRAAPTKSLGNSIKRPTLPGPKETEAVNKLRAQNAAADKADDERFALTDQVDARLTAWKGGKADNLRALLQSLDGVLWESAGWKKVGMSDLVLPNKVKIIYMKAIAKVHPDKISPDATTEQRMISAAVFSTLNEAWDKFKKDNNL
ncbi:Putative UBA-like superfamily, tetratricopeptide-like helical domain superfamily [Septoria linicola]|uniref:UBA-like superfamily, tetratricopeptide-like helical domain superfamily n=1 Tax=Septoria linicola TaxID=215465 RepID=A0A9Q9ASR6_9PEZI|nr:putative UBA-like superfamily, tetratricopeptide-like helical domain superfamily [Septoria linicola]USW51291.1 Putative UBA-like superfamily, tetratricopeptide-like helical domain superfamily [Septoria linicola]